MAAEEARCLRRREHNEVAPLPRLNFWRLIYGLLILAVIGSVVAIGLKVRNDEPANFDRASALGVQLSTMDRK
jgi:hypothetical protein